MMNILGKMAKLQQTMADISARLGDIEVTGESGGGMVTVTATGSQRIRSIKIDQALLDTGDMDMLEDLLVAGLNQALEAAAEKARTQTREAIGGLAPPGFDPDRILG